MSAEMVQTISSRMGTDLRVMMIIISRAGPLPGIPPGDPVRVLEGILDPDVSVQRYHAQTQYGGRGAHHVAAEISKL